MSEQRDGAPEGPLPGAEAHDSEASLRASPYPVSRLAAKISLVDAAREIEQADQWLASTATAQLTAIAEQMQQLREQASRVLEKTQQDAELHRAEARFPRLPGKIYHLYARSDGTRYWSMLSPGEWNGKPSYAFLSSFRLEADRSWTPVEKLAERDGVRDSMSEWMKKKLLP
jgi:hypothetical protein